MSAGRRLDDVLVKVADGEAVDWESLQATALADDDRAWLDAMRVLEDVAAVHRALPNEAIDTRHAISSPRPMRWGKYLLTDRLGSGSFGEVYRAWDPALQRHVAIKLLHGGLPGGDSVWGRLLEEGQRLASVRHPNVISVLEVEQHAGRLALCMEFVRGRTLEEVVQLEGTLSATEAARIGVAVCAALAAVHGAGLVHRDIKAHNVMREDSGRIVLMDFGSGIRFAPGVVGPRMALGTPLYMAPELFEGASATPATDVYSVGVLLYFLVSGHYPVEAPTLDAIQRAHRTRAALPLADRCQGLPPAFVDAVNAALTPDPESRYQTPAALQADLQAMLRVSDRRRTGAGAIAAIGGGLIGAVLLIVALGFLTSSNYQFLLGISGPFATEGWSDYFKWGRRSLVAPAAMAGLVTGLLYLALECFALAQKVSGGFRRRVAALRTLAHSLVFAQRIELRDVARLAVLGSVGFLVWVSLGGFPEFVQAFTTQPLATAPEEALRLLGPASAMLQDAYRQTLSAAVTLMCVVWMTLWRAARRRGSTLGSAGWLGLGCVLASVALMDAPYRILFHYYHEPKERARYAEMDCYVSTQSNEAFLLFCPAGRPRVFSVNRTDPMLERRGTFGSLFENIP